MTLQNPKEAPGTKKYRFAVYFIQPYKIPSLSSKLPIEFHVNGKYINEVVTFYLLWPINFHSSHWDKENISFEKQYFVSGHVMLTIFSALF